MRIPLLRHLFGNPARAKQAFEQLVGLAGAIVRFSLHCLIGYENRASTPLRLFLVDDMIIENRNTEPADRMTSTDALLVSICTLNLSWGF